MAALGRGNDSLRPPKLFEDGETPTVAAAVRLKPLFRPLRQQDREPLVGWSYSARPTLSISSAMFSQLISASFTNSPAARRRSSSALCVDHSTISSSYRSLIRTVGQVFIASKNSLLVLLYFSLSNKNSMASTVPIGLRMRLSTHIFDSTPFSTSNSSLRVPDLVMSIAGNVRLSDNLRSRMISELPVPLNSSKMTSSIRLPVSINAVAMMVSDPPSSILRAAPKNRFGRCNALASTPPVSTLPDDGTTVL